MSYSISTNQEVFQGDFESIEKAIEEAPSELSLSIGQRFYVGKNVHIGYGEQYYPDADEILDMIGERAYEVSEAAEDWLAQVPKEEKADLQEMLTDTIRAWMKKHNQEATFWIVEDIKEYMISEDTVTQTN